MPDILLLHKGSSKDPPPVWPWIQRGPRVRRYPLYPGLWIQRAPMTNPCRHPGHPLYPELGSGSGGPWIPSVSTFVLGSWTTLVTHCIPSRLGPDFGLTLDRLWADFGPTLGRHWADFGPTLGRLWTDFGPTLGRLWADFGPTLGQLWADLGPTLGRLRADLGPTWGRLWAHFGSTSVQLWPDREC